MKTITFYSYKGGAGRTLLLVNTAYYLAGAGKRVVMIDFDLEAPGLHQKFDFKGTPTRCRGNWINPGTALWERLVPVVSICSSSGRRGSELASMSAFTRSNTGSSRVASTLSLQERP